MNKVKKYVSISIIFIMVLTLFTSTAKATTAAKVFSSSKSSYYTNSSNYAQYGLNELGYSVTYSNGKIKKSSMISWITNTSNGYAFYVHTKGGTGYFNDWYGTSSDSSDISGNWDLVYIDSAKSAKNNSLASAFHTIGYSNRCFLGWSDTVTFSNANQFNYYFWTDYVTNATIQAAAIAAAGSVPGTGTTPIRLYGSTTYMGTAR